MSKPLVSIIIPNYNKAPYIRESIESALNQTYKNIEVIVVDDGSTDKSKEIIKSFGKRIKAYFLPHKNANVARNFGFKKSKGEYIQFLDSDDIILPEKIEKQVELLEKTGADMALCYWAHITHSGELKNIKELPKEFHDRELFRWFIQGNWFASDCPLYKRQFIKEITWDENLNRVQDGDFHLKVAMHYPTAKTIPEVLAYYRITSPDYKKMCKYRLIWAQDSFYVYNKLKGKVCGKEKDYLSQILFHIARGIYDCDKNLYWGIVKTASRLSHTYYKSESNLFMFTYKLLGLEFAEKLASLLRKIWRK